MATLVKNILKIKMEIFFAINMVIIKRSTASKMVWFTTRSTPLKVKVVVPSYIARVLKRLLLPSTREMEQRNSKQGQTSILVY